jgi:hypothetical protein
MEEADTTFDEIQACFETLRTAVEERNYPALQLALREQWTLMSSAPSSDPRTETFALKGSALISWALTMVKIQQTGYAHELATILNARYLKSQYAEANASRSELVSVNA